MSPFETLAEVRRRAVEAVLAQSRLDHAPLRRHLRELLLSSDPVTGALMQEPVIEGARPFLAAGTTMRDLGSSGLLNRQFVEAMAALPEGHDYRVPLERKPYQHQLEAWRHLRAPGTPRSVLVTSGTGSGKTECFLYPILSNLADEAGAGATPEGVQALMLYPLNALIESQRERLSAWSAPFGGRIRYCLYNGDLPKQAQPASIRRSTPEQVVDRPALRESPPPILVTNVTMLEYMLARPEDQPILDKSRGKLKWIVLDEAHSLVGAAAAEVALLLRRVMLAFGVSAESVRFIATSATIGDGEREPLGRFLADIAGVPDDNVFVIKGDPKPLRRGEPPRGDVDLAAASPEEAYDLLSTDPEAWQLVERLSRGSMRLSDLEAPAARFGVLPEDLALKLASAEKTFEDGKELLAPMRIHGFERAMSGLWSCLNPGCAGSPEGWEFGRLLAERADACPTCSGPVLELLACSSCGEAFLEGEWRGDRIAGIGRSATADEFAEDSDAEDDPDAADEEKAASDAEGLANRILFAAHPTGAARPLILDPERWREPDPAAVTALKFLVEDGHDKTACPHCTPGGAKRPLLRPLRFGAPFLVGNAAPILLEGLRPADTAEPRPSDGRRLLSFTDSRQGTARFAAKLQMEAERNFVRSYVYHVVQDTLRPIAADPARVARLEAEIAGLNQAVVAASNPALENLVNAKRSELANLTSPRTDGVAWTDLRDWLSARPEVADWIHEVWSARDGDEFSDAGKLAHFLLVREFARRPRTANSLETLGLGALCYPDLESETMRLPRPFSQRGKTLADWQSYLAAVATHFVRANSAVEMSPALRHWVEPHVGLRSLIGPDQKKNRPFELAWPGGVRINARSRIVALLVAGLGIDLKDREDRDDLDECLDAAWRAIGRTLGPNPDRRTLDLTRCRIAPLTEAFVCPVTRRVLDVAPFGLTPYTRSSAAERAEPIALPTHPAPLTRKVDPADARAETFDWLADDPGIAALRDRGVWPDLNDRIALFAPYARSAEHSAQQDGSRLRLYESAFKEGRINVLNCSTTMEMGVDIGSVEAVMMTNVPPSIANYRQRVGRAGRRAQATALAFTFCKDRPLDREAFRDPMRFLARSMAAPKVTLSSRPIVQRHVNAYLLGAFIRERAGDMHAMQIGAFFGCPDDPKAARPPKADRPAIQFHDWLALPSTRSAHADPVSRIARRSVAERDKMLIEDTRSALDELARGFEDEWEGLRTLAREDVSDGKRGRMHAELRRLTQEFLLSGIADRGFLPGHGFPTNVVTFLPNRPVASRTEDHDGTRHRRAVGPQRSLDLAIRDYAPGTDVVLDGLVYRSAGVTLNWKRPPSTEAVNEIQSLREHRRCRDCGTTDTVGMVCADEACRACGSTALKRSTFLRPAGFTVDPRRKPHTKTEEITYVPPQPPQVSTRDAAWHALPLPHLGRIRWSREGLVYYQSRGPGTNAYDVCLHCGRAEPSAPGSLKDHKPLRWKKGQSTDLCEGNANPWKIKEKVALGYETQTDVVELQLPHHALLTRPSADALVVALREGLARRLGIEAEEMGVATALNRGETGRSISLFVFDKTAGGAGFATALTDNLRDTLRRARYVLNCHTPGCESGCSACVRTGDAPEQLDRLSALEYLNTTLVIPDQLPEDERFVPGARLSLYVPDEIDRCLSRSGSARLTLYLPADFDPVLLAAWPIVPSFATWRARGHALRIGLPPAVLATLDPAGRQQLRDFALRHELGLGEAEIPRFANGARLMALVEAGDETTAWAARGETIATPDRNWGLAQSHPIATGPLVPPTFAPLDRDELAAPASVVLEEIEDELDTSLAKFGEMCAERLIGALTSAGAWLNRPISSMHYEDPYVVSPLVARLCVDTMAAIAGRGSSTPDVSIATREPRQAPPRRTPFLAWHDWPDADDQRRTIEAYGRIRRLRLSVHHAIVPHARSLTLAFSDGHAAKVMLDQGFGAWAPPSNVKVKHPFAIPPEAQAAALAKINVVIQRKGEGATYLVATRVESAMAAPASRNPAIRS
ncbi:DEAD/DEAH box helicase [Acuticoccus sp.]|uniref:DEAD/DEAH box helicase n=1 Tax=Acuticoccus sp. TaxID=1904378 RepID=UPI003B51AC9F